MPIIYRSTKGSPLTHAELDGNFQFFTASINAISGAYATTGSNSFNGNQIINGKLSNGSSPNAVGIYSHAEGLSTIASGSYSHAEGGATQATGSLSHAEGDTTRAVGYAAHSEGTSTVALGQSSHAEGNSTISIGLGSHAEGLLTTASNSYSHAEGESTTAKGYISHAEGYGTIASGSYSHAEGLSTIANGDYSHAEGASANAVGSYSHAEGLSTIANGNYSHAEGRLTIASGSYSHAEGLSTIANGNYSHAEGEGTIASGSAQTVMGKYNKQNNDSSLVVIGNGTNGSNRSDIVLVNTGSVAINGSLYIQGVQQTSSSIETHTAFVSRLDPNIAFSGSRTSVIFQYSQSMYLGGSLDIHVIENNSTFGIVNVLIASTTGSSTVLTVTGSKIGSPINNLSFSGDISSSYVRLKVVNSSANDYTVRIFPKLIAFSPDIYYTNYSNSYLQGDVGIGGEPEVPIP